MKDKNLEELILIGKVFNETNSSWMPYVKDLQTHDFDETWVASIMFLILDRYISNVEENKQVGFTKKVEKTLKHLIEEGHSYLTKYSV